MLRKAKKGEAAAATAEGSKISSCKSVKLDELVLYNSKLRFCDEQLQNINFLFHKKIERPVDQNAGKFLVDLSTEQRRKV